MIEKVLLINLPTDGQCQDFYTPKYAVNSFSTYPPLGLLYLATSIKSSYQTEVMDTVALNYSIEKTVNEIIKKAPDVLGISCQTFRLYPMAEIIRQVKSRLPKIVTIVGGPHTSIYPVETMNIPGVDYVITGDGEESLKQLLDALSSNNQDKLNEISGLVFKKENHIIQNPIEYNINIDNIKVPDRSLLDYRHYFTSADEAAQVVTMISSRGCPFRCIFCDVQEKKYRWRSAKSVVDEMEYIANTFENPIIHVFDDTFNLLKDRVLEICREIQKRNLKVNWTTRARIHPFDEEMAAALKQAGLKRIHFGVESGSEVTLKNIRKGIKKEQIVKTFELSKKYNIDTLAYFIIGFDWETRKDINQTISFIKDIRPDYIMANVLYPAAKTEIYEDLLKENKIRNDFWQEFVENPTRNFSFPEYRNQKTQRYLNRKLDEIYLNFYLSPKFVINNLKSQDFIFKVKLAFLIIYSYLTNLISEISLFNEENEIK